MASEGLETRRIQGTNGRREHQIALKIAAESRQWALVSIVHAACECQRTIYVGT